MFDGMLQTILNNANPEEDEPLRDEEGLRAILPFDI
jgi:hypothetical protein